MGMLLPDAQRTARIGRLEYRRGKSLSGPHHYRKMISGWSLKISVSIE